MAVNGGGVYLEQATATVTFRNLTFINNQAQFGAGVVVLNVSSITTRDCLFTGNTATDGGGAMAVSADTHTHTHRHTCINMHTDTHTHIQMQTRR